MATLRLLPPGSGQRGTFKVNGRSYSCALGAAIDVPDFDAGQMLANGWLRPGPVQASGPTAQRPTRTQSGQTLPAGYAFHDTTLGLVILWDGYLWRNPTTGAGV